MYTGIEYDTDLDEIDEEWIEAAREALDHTDVTDPDDRLLGIVAGLIEELDSMDPRRRPEFADEHEGQVHAALLDWIEESGEDDADEDTDD